MRKPTEKQFWIGYACVFIAIQTYAIAHAPPREVFTVIAMVNMLFVIVNLIGTCFAMGGWAPWRDKDEPPPKHSVFGFFRWFVSFKDDTKSER